MDGMNLNLAEAVREFREKYHTDKETIDAALDAWHMRMLLRAWQAIHLPMPTPIYAIYSRYRDKPNAAWDFHHFSVSHRHCLKSSRQDWSSNEYRVLDIIPGDSPGYWHLRLQVSERGMGGWWMKKNSPAKGLDPWLLWWLEGPGYVLGERGKDEAVAQGPEV